MGKKIVYIVGGLLQPNGMSQVLSQKINYLAEHTDYELYMVLTEKAGAPWYYKISHKVKHVNFDINFDELDTLPLLQKAIAYTKKQRLYKKRLTDYLVALHPDIVVTAMRREINFINDIPDGSRKIGEIHFNKSNYREFHKSFLPDWLNHFITKQWRKKLIHEIQRLDKFVVLSQEDRAEWTELDDAQVQVIYNPLKSMPTAQSDCTSKQVIAVGRYTYQKGFDLLIKAWKHVTEKHPDWHLHIYGSGDNTAYQALAVANGTADTVTCHDAVNNIYEKYMESSIFAFSSRYEGFGLVLAEAMSCGLPGVSFACPCGPKDIITDGVDGILIEKENTDALAAALCKLIENDALRKEMGQKAAANMKRFNETEIMKQWIELFD